MLVNLIARLSLLGFSLLLMLANYWFTFGLWPKSWTSFVICSVLSIVLALIHLAISEERK